MLKDAIMEEKDKKNMLDDVFTFKKSHAELKSWNKWKIYRTLGDGFSIVLAIISLIKPSTLIFNMMAIMTWIYIKDEVINQRNAIENRKLVYFRSRIKEAIVKKLEKPLSVQEMKELEELKIKYQIIKNESHYVFQIEPQDIESPYSKIDSFMKIAKNYHFVMEVDFSV